MLLNIKNYIRKPETMELISYAVFPDDRSIEQAIQQYEANDAWQLYGFEDGELLVGLIGFEKMNETMVFRSTACYRNINEVALYRSAIPTVLKTGNFLSG